MLYHPADNPININMEVSLENMGDLNHNPSTFSVEQAAAYNKKVVVIQVVGTPKYNKEDDTVDCLLMDEVIMYVDYGHTETRSDLLNSDEIQSLVKLFKYVHKHVHINGLFIMTHVQCVGTEVETLARII